METSTRLATVTLALALLFGGRPLAAATPDDFYVNLLNRGIANASAGNDAAAIGPLRIAAFGLVDNVKEFALAESWLGVVARRLKLEEDARRTAQRLVAAERIERTYASLPLPANIRAESDALVGSYLPAEQTAFLHGGPAPTPVQPRVTMVTRAGTTMPAVPTATAVPPGATPIPTPAPTTASAVPSTTAATPSATPPAPKQASTASAAPRTPATAPTSAVPSPAAPVIRPPSATAPASAAVTDPVFADEPATPAPSASTTTTTDRRPTTPATTAPTSASTSSQPPAAASPSRPTATPAAPAPSAATTPAPTATAPATNDQRPATTRPLPSTTPAPAPATSATNDQRPATTPRPAPTKPQSPPTTPAPPPSASATRNPQPAIAPTALPSRIAAADAALANGDLLAARAAYAELVDVPNLDHASALHLGESLYDAGDYRGSVRAFQRAGTFRAGEEEQRYTYALALYETGDYRAAKRELAAALPHLDDTPELRRNRAKIEGAID